MAIGSDEIITRFRSNKLAVGEQERVEAVRSLFLDLALDLDRKLPDGRYKSLALTDLETASMYAVKALTHVVA